MKKHTGYFDNGLPYNSAGRGPRPLIIFQGLVFENKPQFGMLGQYRFLGKDYTLFSVLRKPGLPPEYTLKDMADDYATMIREEFGGPVDVLGISTGGSIAQHFAADHPELVQRLILHSSAHTLNDTAKHLQLEVAALAQQGRWRQAWALLISAVFPRHRLGKWLSRLLVGLSAWLLSLNTPQDANDLVVTVEAEDQLAFKARLAEITVPTLVIGGVDDFFYSPELFRETAAGIPKARLCLYDRMGHPAGGKRFRRDVLNFLRDES